MHNFLGHPVESRSDRTALTRQQIDSSLGHFPPPILETADTPIVHGGSPAHYANKMMFIGLPMYFNISINFFYIFAFVKLLYLLFLCWRNSKI